MQLLKSDGFLITKKHTAAFKCREHPLTIQSPRTMLKNTFLSCIQSTNYTIISFQMQLYLKYKISKSKRFKSIWNPQGFFIHL